MAFLDFEASSLSCFSYPISVGWCDFNDAQDEFLIKPAKNWTDWDNASQRIHRLSRSTLLSEGINVSDACKRLNKALRGRDVFCTSSYDIFWKERLFSSASIECEFNLTSWTNIANVNERNVSQLAEEIKKAVTHNALDDALAIRNAISKLLRE